MIRWLIGWYDARRRAIDLEILWPQCKSIATDLDHARAAFMYHALHDNAWRRHMSIPEITSYIEALR